MRYSIVIPTYNHCDDLLRPCIESIIANTNLSQLEVIIVANGCTDNTREYVESLGKPFKLIWFDNPIGYTKAIIEGINYSSGGYIILLNNDCVILDYMEKSKWIDLLEEPFKQDDKVGLTGPSRTICPYTAQDFIIFYCVMIPRKVIKEVGLPNMLFNPGFGEDIDYSIRVKKAGYKIVQVPENYIIPTGKSGNTTFPIWHQAEKTVHAPIDWKKHFGIDSWNHVVERNIEILRKVYPMIEDTNPSFYLDMLKNQDTVLYKSVVEGNEYDLSKEEMQGKTVIDVGANIGFFAAISLYYGASKIICAEPVPSTFNRLSNLYSLDDRVTTLNNAVSDKKGEVVYLTDATTLSYVTNVPTEHSAETITLEDMLAYTSPEDNNLILKLDCEGAEFPILLNTPVSVIRRFEVVHVEMHEIEGINPGLTLGMLRKHVESMGYQETSCKTYWRWDELADGTRINQSELPIKVLRYIRTSL